MIVNLRKSSSDDLDLTYHLAKCSITSTLAFQMRKKQQGIRISLSVHLFQGRLQRSPALPVDSQPCPDPDRLSPRRRRRRLRLLLAYQDERGDLGPTHRAAVHQSDEALPAGARVSARQHGPRHGALLADDAHVPSSSSVVLVAAGPALAAVLADVKLLEDRDVSGAVLEVRRHDLGLELHGGVPYVDYVEDGADVTAVVSTVEILIGWHGANHNWEARAWGSPKIQSNRLWEMCHYSGIIAGKADLLHIADLQAAVAEIHCDQK